MHRWLREKQFLPKTQLSLIYEYFTVIFAGLLVCY